MIGGISMDYQALGRRVRQQRILNDFTQEVLAEKAGISSAFVGHIERGEKKASVETVVALSNALKVSPTILLQDSLNEDVLENHLEVGEANKSLVCDLIQVLREHNRKDPGYF